jgi:hypothetical protein
MREKVVPGWATRLAMAFNALLVASLFLVFNSPPFAAADFYTNRNGPTGSVGP